MEPLPQDLALRTTLSGRHTGSVESVAFTPDGSLLVSGSVDTTRKLWDVITGKNVATLRGHAGAIRCVTFGPDGNTVTSVSDDRTVKLWDLAAAENRATLRVSA